MVLLRPFITSDLVSQTVVAGSEAVFSVAATGSAPLTYVRYLNESLIPSLAGPTLTLPRIDASDEGDYQVVISNGSGSAISATARLTVDDPVLGSLQLEFVGMERGGGFRMRVKGPLNSSYVVWASSDLSDWAAVTTGRAVGGLLSFLDRDAPRHSQRFYRASLAQQFSFYVGRQGIRTLLDRSSRRRRIIKNS